jgi:hypothetical protein
MVRLDVSSRSRTRCSRMRALPCSSTTDVRRGPTARSEAKMRESSACSCVYKSEGESVCEMTERETGRERETSHAPSCDTDAPSLIVGGVMERGQEGASI